MQTQTKYPSRQLMLQLVMFGMAAVLLFSGYMRMTASAAAMRSANDDLHECKRLVGEINQLRQLPQFAALEPDSPQVTGERIEEAREQAKLPASSIIRIQPLSAYRLGSSEYRLWPTRLELKGVTMQQLATFAYALSDEERGLTVRDLRIWTNTSESSAGTKETWAVEITLTQVTFFPTSRR